MESDLVRFAHFCMLRGKYILLRRACDVLVELHVRSTPRVATEDTFNTIIQEQLRKHVRRIEFRCHTLKEKYEAIGKEILRHD